MMENDGATKREKARKILLEQFLAGKHKESGFRDLVIVENRELMPELEEEFLKLEKINAAVQGADRSGVATDARQNSTLPKRGEVEVTDAEMTQAIMAQARQYPGQERQFFEFIQQNAQAQQQLRAPLFEDKVVDFVFELAQISETETDKDALKTAVEALEDE